VRLRRGIACAGRQAGIYSEEEVDEEELEEAEEGNGHRD